MPTYNIKLENKINKQKEYFYIQFLIGFEMFGLVWADLASTNRSWQFSVVPDAEPSSCPEATFPALLIYQK